MRISAWTLLLTLAAPGLAGAATVELISGNGPATDSLGHTIQPVLSADGRYVAFLSDAPNLAPGQKDDNGALDAFLHDRVLGTTTLVSHAAGSPTRAASPGIDPFGFHEGLRILDISADGRYVAFSTSGVDLVPGAAGSNRTFNVFLWDRVTGTATLASHAAGSPGTAADGSSFNARISADGNFLAFTSLASNLVAGQADTNTSGPTTDVFLWNRATDTATLVSRGSGTAAGPLPSTPASTPPITGNQPSFAPVLSADGGVVVFTTLATNLLSTVIDTNTDIEIYAYQRSTDTLSLVSRSAGAPQPAAGASPEGLAVSADGRYVAFTSHSADLVPGQVDDAASFDAFLYDRATGEMRLVSHRSLSPLLAGGIFNPADIALSADGHSVAFSSGATDLAPGQVDTNQYADVFVYDRDTGLVALASHRHGSATTAGSGFSVAPRLSADGRFLVFHSQSVDLVRGQTDIPNTIYGGTPDVFLYDQTSRSVTLLSRTRASASDTGNQSSFDPVLSADGSVAAFLSEATDLGEGQVDPYGFVDLFLYYRTSGEITSASARNETPAGGTHP
jgi:Tol biopolymer transport system component